MKIVDESLVKEIYSDEGVITVHFHQTIEYKDLVTCRCEEFWEKMLNKFYNEIQDELRLSFKDFLNKEDDFLFCKLPDPIPYRFGHFSLKDSITNKKVPVRIYFGVIGLDGGIDSRFPDRDAAFIAEYMFKKVAR